ncbi:sensor histidine kinase [Methylocucumis oryzae]|uniref:histidine kinase n=1 Tax=Methylocucumis oryzae TaxID=1632867 RepID=A0A0F3IJF5_9GAMM|nr:HAMP domain-containing sensor histidine kinase [Methylocucumis oryzae]KJV05679.1 hypothetical protein VZ94_16340 [Methylocucumis oryzae]
MSFLGKVYYFHDITKNEEIERIKNDFLAHATHELRTPLTSILGYSELLTMEKIPVHRQVNICFTIYEQAKHLNKLVNELFDYTKIMERGRGDLTILTYSLTQIIEEAIVDTRFSKNRGDIVFHKPTHNLMVQIDVAGFRQVLIHLIDNAIKYSPERAYIFIDTVYHELTHKVEVNIVDEGIGMTDEQISAAFEQFYRVDKSGAIPGNGLGLSLAKEIITLLDGEIQLYSTLGIGTRVSITMPTV